MRVLITGIEGFVGGHLCERLSAEGHEVWGTTLEDPPPDRPRWLRCDVRDLDQVRGALRESAADAVVHLAARSSVAESHADPRATCATNVGGALNVLEAARRVVFGGPILLVGSGEVYGEPRGARPVDEDAPLRPLSPYAASKAAQEVFGGLYARAYGLHVVLTRSFSHTGSRHDPRFVFPSFARQLAGIERAGGRGTLRVGNLAPVRDYLDVRDVVRAYALLLDRGEPGSVLNVCSGQGFPLRDYLDELVELSGVRVEVVEGAELVREIEIERLVGDPGRLMALGWRPEIAKRTMLEDLLNYWRERT